MLAKHIGKFYLFDVRLPYVEEHRAQSEFEAFLKNTGLGIVKGGVPDRLAAAKAGLGKFGRNNFFFHLSMVLMSLSIHGSLTPYWSTTLFVRMSMPPGAVRPVQLLTKAEEQGYPWVQYHLASLYRNGGNHRGISLPKDERKAFELFKALEYRDNIAFRTGLAGMYANGLGVTKGIDKALEMLSSVGFE